MARKIRLVGYSICFLIFIVAFIAVCVLAGNGTTKVKDVVIAKTSDTSISLEWSAAKKVDGYQVFAKSNDMDDFYVAETVSDASTTNVTVKGLQANTDYKVYVASFKGEGDDKRVGKKQKAISITTLPMRPKANADSAMSGELVVSWKKQKDAAGYEVSYKGGSDKKVDVIEGNKKSKKTYTDRQTGVIYKTKVRSFIYKDKEKVYSPWSETVEVKISNKRIQSNQIDPNKPMIALSFDDGPDSKNAGASDKILDVLEEYNAKATFFMLGSRALENPDNVKRKVKLGMEIGNHTYDHNHYGKNINKDDILKSTNAIKKVCGIAPTAFRSPGGITNDFIRNECEAEGMVLYYWSVDTVDWRSRDASSVSNIVLNNVSDGDIVLMHEIYMSTADAVEIMVPKLIEQGYQLVTCADLVKYKTGKDPVVGTQYVTPDQIRNTTN